MPKYTDIDLWGGGPEWERKLVVLVSDSALANVTELASPGKHLRRFRVSLPQNAKPGRTMLEAKLPSGAKYSESVVVRVHRNYNTILTFQKLWNGYPVDEGGVKKRIKGGCDSYTDQCAIRLSVALAKAGVPLTGYQGLTCKADGLTLARNAPELANHLSSKIGPPEKMGANQKKSVENLKGIVFFQNTHIDVWNGQKTRSAKQFYKSIWFWELKSW